MNLTLKEMRMKNGLTQTFVAKELKTHVQYWSNIERGITFPAPKYFKTLAKLLKTNEVVFVDMAVARFRENLLKKINRKYATKAKLQEKRKRGSWWVDL